MFESVAEVLFNTEPGVNLPKQAYEGDAGFDLEANEECLIRSGEVKKIRTGLRLAIPLGYEGQVRPRSGLALKKNVTVANTPGTIDAGYRDEIAVLLRNDSEEAFRVSKGDRIAQLVIQKLPAIRFVFSRELPPSERGKEGFGSSGVERKA